MIPSAITSTGPYADVWSYLKSIDHAIERVLDSSVTRATPLDKDRLSALIDLLNNSVAPEVELASESISFMNNIGSPYPDYSSAINLRSKVESNKDFIIWKKKNRKKAEDLLAKLKHAVERYILESDDSLFQLGKHTDELKILQSIMGDLIADAEVAMKY